jgi:hypothetical protein
MTTNKEKLAQNIKNWLSVDKEIKLLQNELKERKKKKIAFTTNLVEIMKENEIDCFDISEGKIIYTQSNVKQPINKQHLLECLSKYFENHQNIPTDEIVKFILENRSVNVKEGIRHKPPKIM